MTSNGVSLDLIDQLEKMGTMISDNMNNIYENDSMLVSSLKNRHLSHPQKQTNNCYSLSKNMIGLPQKNQFTKFGNKNNNENQQKLKNKENQVNTCGQCKIKVSHLEEEINQIKIKMQNLQINLNISFTKHMENTNSNGKQIKAIESIEYSQWAVKTKLKQIEEKFTHQFAHLQRKNAQLQGQIGSLRFKKQQPEYSNIVTLDYTVKGLQQKVCRQKEETDSRLSQVMQAVQQMGILQKKLMIELQNFKSKIEVNEDNKATVSLINLTRNSDNKTILQQVQNCSCLLKKGNIIGISDCSNMMDEVGKKLTKKQKKRYEIVKINS